MGNTTFEGPVRSEGGFVHVSKNATTGVETETTAVNSSGELVADQSGAALTTGAGTGITGGTGTVATSEIVKNGKVITTQLYIDLTGLDSDATEGDIIGLDGTANPCHFGAITTAESGVLYAGTVTCIEAPTTGEVDIDLYAADEATGVTDGAIGDLTETACLATAADWTQYLSKALTAFPTDGQYLYLTVGTASSPTAGTYDAGIFMIELFGYEA